MRYLVPGMLVAFVLASVLAEGCARAAPHSDNEVVWGTFYKVVKQSALPEREEILRWWGTELALAEVKYLKKEDTYEIYFPTMDHQGVEIWGIDMKTSKIWPINFGAVSDAILLFCQDRQDQRLHCRQWFGQLDATIRSLGE